MRKVHKKFDAVPNCLQTPGCEEKRLDALRNKNKDAFKGPYGDKEVKDALEVIYLKKCAYCESDGKEAAPFQVDHYRPKKGVKDDPAHPGYYWLAYEWSNLILSCANCNRPKSTQFPVAGVRVSSHPMLNNNPEELNREHCLIVSAELTAEQPYIVNPETDDNPAAHFSFATDGRIGHKTTAGAYTIRVCDLMRDELVLKRKEIFDEVLLELLVQCKAYDIGEIDERQLWWGLLTVVRRFARRVKDDTKPYTACARTLWNNFRQLFFIPQPDHQARLNGVYEQVNQETNVLI
ncbi:HNH endonuclease [Spirosoma fluviale]|uniref:TIGR02646 family protein n=1 Tax=Spirosoma fluviale TaxID=1597977 RepID=A0A286F9L7_9BACT|nr:HNH endonuclease [Spirosoma fluviale]SOD79915.1 TIGR02646 family protein [Spirosoma fluviale]